MASRIAGYSAALVLLAGTAIVVVADPGRAAPQPAAIQPVAVTVAPGPTTLACPGPLVTGTSDLTKQTQELTFDPQFDPNKSPSVPSLRAIEVAPTGTKIAGGSRPISDSKPVPFTATGQIGLSSATNLKSVTVLSAPATVKGLPELTGSVVSVAGDGDLRGLAGAVCQPARSEMYLVGGDTLTQTTANLFLANTGATAAEVSVDIWGATGPIHTIATDAIVVPTNSERALQLPGVAKNDQRIVVRVTVTGGEVAAYLQDSRLDGITPQGVDYVVPSRGPERTATITGLRINKTDASPAAPAIIRLLAPGSRGAKATIRLYGPAGAVDAPDLEGIELDAGIVTDVPVAGMGAGLYTAHVTADQPIVAGALTTNPSDTKQILDRAWVPSSAAGNGLLALAGGPTATLAVYSQADAQVTLTPIGANGKRGAAKAVQVAKDKTLAVPVGDLGSNVAAVEWQSKQPVWLAAVLTQSADGGDLVTVLTPAMGGTPQNKVSVGVGTRLGLG